MRSRAATQRPWTRPASRGLAALQPPVRRQQQLLQRGKLETAEAIAQDIIKTLAAEISGSVRASAIWPA